MLFTTLRTNVHLLPCVSHSLTGAMMKRYLVLSHLRFRSKLLPSDWLINKLQTENFINTFSLCICIYRLWSKWCSYSLLPFSTVGPVCFLNSYWLKSDSVCVSRSPSMPPSGCCQCFFCLWTEIRSRWDLWQFNGLNLIFVALLSTHFLSLYLPWLLLLQRESLEILGLFLCHHVCKLQSNVTDHTSICTAIMHYKATFSHHEHFICPYWWQMIHSHYWNDHYLHHYRCHANLPFNFHSMLPPLENQIPRIYQESPQPGSDNSPFSGWRPWPQIWRCSFSSLQLQAQLQIVPLGARWSQHNYF